MGITATLETDTNLFLSVVDPEQVYGVLQEVERRFETERLWTRGAWARTRWGFRCDPWHRRACRFCLHAMIIHVCDEKYPGHKGLFVSCAAQQACSIATRRLFKLPDSDVAYLDVRANHYVNDVGGLAAVRKVIAAAKTLPELMLSRATKT